MGATDALERIQRITGADKKELKKATRGPMANPARRFAVWALRNATRMTQAEIGDILGNGGFLNWLRTDTGATIADAVPTQNGVEPPWPGGEIFFFRDFATAPYFDKNATKTNATGAMLLKNAPFGTYSANKTGCTFNPGAFATKAQRLVFFDQRIPCS